MAPKPKTKPTEWRSRIVDSGMVDAATLTANPRNARKHPPAQRAALKGVLSEVGWVGRVIVNRTTGLIVDGHLRVDEASKRGEQVPVDWVELDEAEEAMILALYDPIGALAETDQAALDDLLGSIETANDDVLALIAELQTAGDDDPGTGFAGDAATDDMPVIYGVSIVCSSEEAQRDLLDRFEKEGLECRALMS